MVSNRLEQIQWSNSPASRKPQANRKTVTGVVGLFCDSAISATQGEPALWDHVPETANYDRKDLERRREESQTQIRGE